MTRSISLFIILAAIINFTACNQDKDNNKQEQTEPQTQTMTMRDRVNQYAVIDLKADLSQLTENQKKMINELIQTAKIVDDIFWKQAYGNKEELLSRIKDPDTAKFVEINYGPWDRLSGNQTFVNGIDKKPLGANFYPQDIKYFPFIQLNFQDKLSMYTLLKRDENQELYTIPYHEAFKEEIAQIVEHLQKAADLAENSQLKDYLLKRINALQTDDYYESDAAFVDLKDNLIDFTIGSFENEEDHFLYLKGAYEASVMIKDVEWTNKFTSYLSFLPDLQKELPVEDIYKSQKIGINSGIVVCNVLYNGGYSNAGPKQIALTRPTDGKIQMEKGTKKLQFKNVTEAKFQKILYPIAELLMDSSQLTHVKSNSFFENNLFFEICNGMLLTQTIDGKGPVKETLNETYNVIIFLNNYVLRLYLIQKLNEKGVLKENDINDNFATQIADIFRAVRFGTAHSQGKAAMISFNYYMEKGAINRNEAGIYKIDFQKMKEVNEVLTQKVIKIQGDGNYQEAKSLIRDYGMVKETLQKDLDKIRENKIPVDIIFNQGESVLGL